MVTFDTKATAVQKRSISERSNKSPDLLVDKHAVIFTCVYDIFEWGGEVNCLLSVQMLTRCLLITTIVVFILFY